MKKRKSPLVRDLWDNRIKWLMVLPAAIVVILMCYIPMAGIVLAFKEFNYYDGVFGSPWVGLENFQYFFKSGKAWLTTRNTVLYNIAFLCVNTVLQISCAIMLSELAGKFFKRITQSVMFFPYFISWVVVGAFIYNMFNYEFGAVNTFLKSIGVEPIDVYSNKGAWPFILIAVSAIFILIYIIMMISGREGKKQIKRAKRYYKWFKLAMKGVSLFIIVYSFIAASGSEKSSMLVPSILISIWLIQVSVEISKHRARVRREKFKAKVSEFTSKFKKKKPETAEAAAEQYSDLEVDLVLARTDDIKLSDEDF